VTSVKLDDKLWLLGSIIYLQSETKSHSSVRKSLNTFTRTKTYTSSQNCCNDF